MQNVNTGRGILVNVDRSLVDFAHRTPITPEEFSDETTPSSSSMRGIASILAIALCAVVVGTLLFG